MPGGTRTPRRGLNRVRDGGAGARNEAAILALFLIARSGHLLLGGVCTVTAWRSYRRPRLVLATLGISFAESAWLAHRCWRRGAFDEALPAWVDGATAVAGVLALAAATTVEDRTAWVNWVSPLAYTSAGAMALGLSPGQGAAGTAALAGTYLATAASGIKRGGSLSATGLANTLSYAGFFFASGVVARQLRRSARELEIARNEAIERADHLATEHERNRQYRLLHDSALQTLEAVAAGWGTGSDESLRNRARHETARLRRTLYGEDEAAGLRVELGALVQTFSREGVDVNVLVSDLDREPSSAATTALFEAASEAVRNVVKHAGVSAVTIRVVTDGDRIELTIRDEGVGFDPAVRPARFGVSNSIVRRMREAGGEATIRSAPGQGTLVTLSVPR